MKKLLALMVVVAALLLAIPAMQLAFADPPSECEGFRVSICHSPPGNPESNRTIEVCSDSLGDHFLHGDVLGTCEA